MTTDISTDGPDTNSSGVKQSPIIGILLVIPALLCCITELLIPTFQTFSLSFQESNFLSDRQFIGAENYSRLFQDARFWETAFATIPSVIFRLILVSIIPLLLAWAIGQYGRKVRLTMRIIFSMPIAIFTPIVISLVWVWALNPVMGLFSTGRPLLASPNTAAMSLRLIDGLYLFGLACGLGLIFYLPLWRNPAGSPPVSFKAITKPLIGLWGISILTTLALTLQTFTPSLTMTRGGPANSTSTLGFLIYTMGFSQFRFGYAATIASFMLTCLLGLGLIAGLLAILTKLRLSTIPQTTPVDSAPNKSSSDKNVAALVILIVLLIPALCTITVSMGVLLWGISHSTMAGSFSRLFSQISVIQTFIYSILPPIPAIIIQLSVAYLAALGLGVFKPLGKNSRWGLFLFSPWLFVTVLPFSLVSFTNASELGTLNTFLGLIPPILISVPALFILTFFFEGTVSRISQESDQTNNFLKQFILPSLPLLGVLFLFLLFIQSQEFLWSILVSQNLRTVGAVLFQLQATSLASFNIIAAGIIVFILPFVVFFLIVLIVFQIFYLDKLSWLVSDE